MRQPRNFYLFALIFVFSAASTVFGQESISGLIDFPGASSTQAWGINARGEIVGFYTSADSVTHGFALRWNQFRAIDVPDAASTSANALNGHGDIVGSYVDANNVTHGFVLSGGQFTTVDFPVQPAPKCWASTTAVNSSATTA